VVIRQTLNLLLILWASNHYGIPTELTVIRRSTKNKTSPKPRGPVCPPLNCSTVKLAAEKLEWRVVVKTPLVQKLQFLPYSRVMLLKDKFLWMFEWTKCHLIPPKTTNLDDEKSLFIQLIAGLHLMFTVCTMFAVSDRFEFSNVRGTPLAILFLMIQFQIGVCISYFLLRHRQNSQVFAYGYNTTMLLLAAGLLLNMDILDGFFSLPRRIGQLGEYVSSFLLGHHKDLQSAEANCNCGCSNCGSSKPSESSWYG